MIKKVKLIFMTMALMLTVFNFSFSQTRGDVDKDGIINIIDALKMAHYDVGLPVTGIFDTSVADVSCDNDINILDALMTAQYFVDLITKFTACNSGPGNSRRIIKVVNEGVPISLEAIDASYYQTARQELDLIYSGTSHSSQINTGIAELANREAWCEWIFREGTYGLDGDLGNPDLFTWSDRTRSYLDANPEVNVCMWSWCGQVGNADVEAEGHYLDLMEQLITDYPAVTFVFMTGHCDGNGPDGAANRENEKIRAHCRANNRWLFDFADFDATAPDGTNYLALNVNDRCEYDGGNWATSWIADHPGDWNQCSCVHSSGEASLNCNRKAIGFVYLMARLAGWDGF